MILMQANPLQGYWKGCALKIKPFCLGPAMATSEAIFRATPSNGPSNGFALIKIIKS
jgi:hypothetical protein